MTAATTAPSGHASAVQPPGRHVERRAWSWSGPLHLPWPSRALKIAKMWSVILGLRRSCGDSAGVMTATQNATSGTKETGSSQRNILETTLDQSCTLMGLEWGQNRLSRFEALRGLLKIYMYNPLSYTPGWEPVLINYIREEFLLHVI